MNSTPSAVAVPTSTTNSLILEIGRVQNVPVSVAAAPPSVLRTHPLESPFLRIQSSARRRERPARRTPSARTVGRRPSSRVLSVPGLLQIEAAAGILSPMSRENFHEWVGREALSPPPVLGGRKGCPESFRNQTALAVGRGGGLKGDRPGWQGQNRRLQTRRADGSSVMSGRR